MKLNTNPISRLLILLLLMCSILACSENKDGVNAPRAVEIRNDKTNVKNKMLAYEHSVTIKHSQDEILSAYNSTIKLCQTNIEINCSLLYASFSSENYSRPSIKVRVDAAGVDVLINHAKANGEISSQSTSIDDLTKSFVETEKRIEMLTQYRDKLLQIQIKAANDVESLIRIAKELTTTQKQLEQTKSSKFRLEQRTDRDLLIINFIHNQRTESIWDSLSGSIADIPENFTYGLSETIEEIVYLIPWFFISVFLFIFFRWLWHKTKPKTKK
jgi:hypothetical protein